MNYATIARVYWANLVMAHQLLQLTREKRIVGLIILSSFLFPAFLIAVYYLSQVRNLRFVFNTPIGCYVTVLK